MPPISLTDQEIDTRARVYARDHRVNYSEALSRVVAFAEAQGGGEPLPQAVNTPTDADLDAEARRYAVSRGVDYFTALKIVAQSHAQSGASASAVASFGESSDPTRGSALDLYPSMPPIAPTDHEIDRRAKVYARDHRVSYAEALSHVVTFAEAPVGMADSSGDEPLEIFRAGVHVSNAGERLNFTVGDVQAIAKNYATATHEAPLVVGHPESDKPAYGWVKQLEATPDGRLLMRAQQVNSDFAALVREGRFKKRSASFYSPQDRSNPTPGNWYLRHVGWLGAMPPAIKGLRDAQFSMPTDTVSFTFAL